MSYTIMPVLPLSMSAGLKKAPDFTGNTVLASAAGRGNAALIVKPFCTWLFE